MTQTPHDRFAKEYLSDLFESFGDVQPGRELYGEVQQIDLWFEPHPNAIATLEPLGTLGRIASRFCAIEPFRNPVQCADVQNCIGKLFAVYSELRRKAKRDRLPPTHVPLPMLWIVTPTASQAVLKGFNVQLKRSWQPGIYFLADQLFTAIVVLHELPRTPDTLWLRLMGRGTVQKQAIAELLSLPLMHPFRGITLEHLAKLQITLNARQNLNKADKELTMNLSPVYEKWLEETLQQGRQEGRQEGQQEGQQTQLIALLKARFGELSAELMAIVPALMQLSEEERARMVLQLSAEELLDRFRSE